MDRSNKKNSIPSLVIKILFINLLIVVEFALVIWKPLIACVFFLLIFVNIIVICILRPFPKMKKYAKSVIQLMELVQATKLLRYATAILAFISFLTTAKGMKSYVFDYEWQAYMGSFAVQSILVVFSLILCHLFTAIGKIEGIGDVGKRMLLSALTLFFSLALVVSSVFSYSYIANNAYKDTWAGDAETMIQDYLIREAKELRAENERIGRLLLNDIISKVNRDFGSLIADYIDEQQGNAQADIKAFQLEELDLRIEDFNVDEYFVNLRTIYPRRVSEVDFVERSYQDSFYKPINDSLDEYTGIISDLSAQSLSQNFDETIVRLKEISEKLDIIMNNVNRTIESMDGWRTYFLDKDLQPIKTNVISSAKEFYDFVNREKNKVDTLIVTVSNAETGEISSSGKSISKQLIDIQHNIYLLKVNQLTLSESSQIEIEKIIDAIVDLLEDLRTEGAFSSSDISSIVVVVDELNEYRKYLNLASDLQSFFDSNLSITYSIQNSRYEYEDKLETEAEEVNIGTVKELSVDEWRTIRDRDFHLLFSMLKELPDQNVITTLSEKDIEAGALDDSFIDNVLEEEIFDSLSENAIIAESAYDSVAVLQEASSLRRDLVGDITEFERAINYFTSDYKKMAFFSAFIAVFLDLGAFLTGCFLYGMRYIQVELYQEDEMDRLAEDDKTSQNDDVSAPDKDK